MNNGDRIQHKLYKNIVGFIDEKYKNHLCIFIGDKTSYEGSTYIDISISDFKSSFNVQGKRIPMDKPSWI